MAHAGAGVSRLDEVKAEVARLKARLVLAEERLHLLSAMDSRRLAAKEVAGYLRTMARDLETGSAELEQWERRREPMMEWGYRNEPGAWRTSGNFTIRRKRGLVTILTEGEP